MIGIDLGTKNCGWCILTNKVHTGVFGLKELSKESIIKFGDALALAVRNQEVFVDFTFNEIFLPGQRKHQAVKYYLAGVIFSNAAHCEFVSPAEIRAYYGKSSKMKKEDLHRDLFLLLTQYNMIGKSDHEIDAFLLAWYGSQKGLGL